MEDQKVVDYFIVAGLEENPTPLSVTDETEAFGVRKAVQDPITDLVVINRTAAEEVPEGYTGVEQTPTGFIADLNFGSFRWPQLFLCYKRGRDKPPLVHIGVLFEDRDRLLPHCELVNDLSGRPANVNNGASKDWRGSICENAIFQFMQFSGGWNPWLIDSVCFECVNVRSFDWLIDWLVQLENSVILFAKKDFRLYISFMVYFGFFLGTKTYIYYKRANLAQSSPTDLVVTEVCVVIKDEKPPHTFWKISDRNLNNSLMGSDVFLCYKKAMASRSYLMYQPGLLFRYPSQDDGALALPLDVGTFSMPMGVSLEAWPRGTNLPRPVFAKFVLTVSGNGNEVRFWGSVLWLCVRLIDWLIDSGIELCWNQSINQSINHWTHALTISFFHKKNPVRSSTLKKSFPSVFRLINKFPYVSIEFSGVFSLCRHTAEARKWSRNCTAPRSPSTSPSRKTSSPPTNSRTSCATSPPIKPQTSTFSTPASPFVSSRGGPFSRRSRPSSSTSSPWPSPRPPIPSPSSGWYSTYSVTFPFPPWPGRKCCCSCPAAPSPSHGLGPMIHRSPPTGPPSARHSKISQPRRVPIYSCWPCWSRRFVCTHSGQMYWRR